MPRSTTHLIPLFVAGLLLTVEANGQSIDAEIVVWGHDSDLLGNADSASHGLIGYADFSTRPLARIGELVEVVPGMIATQHSGPGKANQYFLRGVNLDHGSDFSARFDGMPVNMRTHAHASGYLDLNFMIPEMIETVEYRKGPYYADTGDFSAIGATTFKTYDDLEQNFLQLEAGSENDYRIVGGYSHTFTKSSLLVASEVSLRDGPWELDQNLHKINAMIKYSGTQRGFDTHVLATAYDAHWSSTNQIPRRAVSSGSTSRFGFIDPDLGGDSSRYSVIASAANENIELSGYVSYYEMNLINNPTYFLNDPVNGDEFEQEDQRWIYGLMASHESETEIAGHKFSPHLGVEVRFDDIGKVNLFNTVSRTRTNTIRKDQVKELSLSLFGEAEITVTKQLRATIGLRWDYYDFEVAARNSVNSGSDHDSLLQPKFGLAYAFGNGLETYANYGIGFHSNDVRGAVLSVDPVTNAPAQPIDTLVKAEGAEIGMRMNLLRQDLKITFAGFWLELDSELLFVGDSGTSEPNEATRRYGLELVSFWSITDWMVLDAAFTKTEARFKGLPDDQDQVPDAHGITASAGITILTPNDWTASLRLRHFSDASLVKDRSVRKKASTLLNLGTSKALGKFEIGLKIFNLLDAKDDDIAFFFQSRLRGEPAPIEDIHFHPAEERAFKFSLKYKF